MLKEEIKPTQCPAARKILSFPGKVFSPHHIMFTKTLKTSLQS